MPKTRKIRSGIYESRWYSEEPRPFPVGIYRVAYYHTARSLTREIDSPVIEFQEVTVAVPPEPMYPGETVLMDLDFNRGLSAYNDNLDTAVVTPETGLTAGTPEIRAQNVLVLIGLPGDATVGEVKNVVCMAETILGQTLRLFFQIIVADPAVP